LLFLGACSLVPKFYLGMHLSAKLRFAPPECAARTGVPAADSSHRMNGHILREREAQKGAGFPRKTCPAATPRGQAHAKKGGSRLPHSKARVAHAGIERRRVGKLFTLAAPFASSATLR